MNPKRLLTKEQGPRGEGQEFYTKGRNCKGLGREQMLKKRQNGKELNEAKPFVKKAVNKDCLPQEPVIRRKHSSYGTLFKVPEKSSPTSTFLESQDSKAKARSPHWRPVCPKT